MKSFSSKLASALGAGVLLAALSAPANAAYVDWSWTDIYDPSPDLSVPPSRTYTHDISNSADDATPFRPGEDILTWFQLTVDLYDDKDTNGEVARIDVPTFFWEDENPWDDDKAFGDNWYWSVSGDEFGGWSLAGLLSLNLTGTYTVTVSAVSGDFLFASSRLDARGWRNGGDARAVPEPGTLALIALGLIGMGVALSRRRKSK